MSLPDFPKTVEALLVHEYGKSESEAAALVKKHSNIVVNGIMAGITIQNVRAVAMAIDMAESEAATS